MSRHRNLRNIDVDDYYGEDDDDEYYGYGSYQDDIAMSPSMAQYMVPTGNPIPERSMFDEYNAGQGGRDDDGDVQGGGGGDVFAFDEDVNTTAKPLTPDPVGLATLTEMGFSETQASQALLESNNDLNAASDWLVNMGLGGGGFKVASISSSAQPASPSAGSGAAATSANDSGVRGAQSGAVLRRGDNQPGGNTSSAGGSAAKGKAAAGAGADADADRPATTQLHDDIDGLGLGGLSKKDRGVTVDISRPDDDDENGLPSSRTSRSNNSPGWSPSTPGSSKKRSKLTREIAAEMEAELASEGAKTPISLVVAGHVDHGKSTLMGHLLYDLGIVSQREMHKFEKDSAALGKGSFSYAWVLDAHEEERERGITMDVAVNHFETETKTVTLLDAPGHRDYIPNMITGAAQADVALLVVSAAGGELESGFGPQGQTREHAVLVRALGVKQLIVAVNKLDAVSWSQERYNEIVERLEPFLRQTGFEFTFIPVSGLSGDNLARRTEEGAELYEWYDGPTLLELIEGLEPTPRELDKPFVLSVSDVYQSRSMGAPTVGGRVEAGVCMVGDSVLILPASQIFTVKAIEKRNDGTRWAAAGENADVAIAGVDFNILATARFLCDPVQPLAMATSFRATLIVLDIPVPITKGYQALLHYQNLSEPVTVTKLLSTKSAKALKKNPRRIGRKEQAVVVITCERPICIAERTEVASLGRFMLRDGGQTLACGIVDQILSAAS